MRTIPMVLIGTAAAVSAFGFAGAKNPTPTGAAEVAISSAVVPSGGTTQLNFRLTQPSPITSTGTGFAMDGFEINGLAISSPLGTACGVGTVQNGVLHLNAIDPSGSLGNADYPFAMVTMTAPSQQKTGTTFPFSWAPDAWMNNLTGAYNLITKPGQVTIGGSLSVSGVYPGGGTYLPGTAVRILGTGFNKSLRLTTAVRYSAMVVSPNEITLVLKDQTVMDGQKFIVTNPDGSSATYYSYMRGVMVRPPSQALLRTAEFGFPQQTHGIATIPAQGALSASQWVGIALQNPNPGPVVVTVELEPHGQGRSATFVLLPGTRLVDSISGLLGGLAVQPTDSVRILSTSMIQMFGIQGDDAAKTLKPFVLTF